MRDFVAIPRGWSRKEHHAYELWLAGGEHGPWENSHQDGIKTRRLVHLGKIIADGRAQGFDIG